MLDEKGFKRKRFLDWWADIETKARTVFGEKINLTERTPLGIILRLIAWSLGLISQLAENVYNSAFVDTAKGVSLDRVVKRIGIRRHKADYARGFIRVTGTNGKLIPSDFRVRTNSGIVFATTEAATISETGTVMIPIRALDIGTSGNVPENTITVVVNPNGDVQSVTNPQRTEGGRERETDLELRERYDLSLSKGGSSTVESIRSTLLQLTGVRGCIVEENDSLLEKEGIPPKAVAPIVFGGSDQEIAVTIKATKAGGIQSWGETEVTVIDSMGNPQIIGFTRPTEVPIYINVTLSTNENFPVDGKTHVRSKLIQSIGGQDADETIYDGLGLEENVVHSRLISSVYQVPGIEDVELTLGEDPLNMSEGNILISKWQVAQTDWQKVTVI